MQTQVNMSGSKSPSQILEKPGFDQMAKSLSTAIAEFDDSSGILSSIANILRPAWKATASYMRRHPVQAVVGVAAVGIASILSLRPNAPLVSKDNRDKRRY